ncbi:MAG: endolytic transglycosylase MltG, partial [Solirubrobacteraceae bacterium]
MTEGERSAQEREAARRERERMRAARRRGDDQDHERGDHEEDRDVDGEPDLYADHEADLDADDELDGYADHDGFADDELGRYADHELDADADADGYEVPAGTRRVARSERLQELDRAGERVRLSRRSPAPKRAPAKRHSYAGRVLALLALIAGVALIWFLVQLFQPLHGSGGASVTVTIPPRTSSSAIGDLLARDGVVSSGFFFKLRVALGGDRGKLLAGTYHLKRDMTYGAVLKLLTTPPPAAPVSELTITPGRTRRQVDALLAAQHIRGSYLVATRRSRLLNPSAYGAPRDTPSLEGFLFPDTFQLRDPVSIT